MKKPILMPALSDTMQTGRLTRWNKSVGDPVRTGESVAEVETDKAILDVEAFADGYLAGPLAPTDQDIPIRQTIAYIADRPEAASDATAQAQKAAPAADRAESARPQAASRPAGDARRRGPVTPIPPPEPAAEGRGHAAPMPHSPPSAAPGVGVSPYARALARDLGVDIAEAQAGPDGQVHARHVLAVALQPQGADLRLGPPYEITRPGTLRAAVARNMSATLQTPTFRISSRLPLGPLHQKTKTKKVSLTLALSRACALTVAEDPWFNHAWTPKGLAIRKRVDLGIAVDTGAGLITPVLRDAANRPLEELAEDWRILLEKVKSGRLAPEHYQGASFYLSNLGIFPEVVEFDAIVPAGASAILGVSAPGTDGNTTLTLSCDHRVIFGADAARFLQRLRKRLEDLSWLA